MNEGESAQVAKIDPAVFEDADSVNNSAAGAKSSRGGRKQGRGRGSRGGRKRKSSEAEVNKHDHVTLCC